MLRLPEKKIKLASFEIDIVNIVMISFKEDVTAEQVEGVSLVTTRSSVRTNVWNKLRRGQAQIRQTFVIHAFQQVLESLASM